MSRRASRLFATACTAWLLLAAPLLAAPTAQQKRDAAALQTKLKQAGGLFQQRKYAESGAVLAELMEGMEKLAAQGPDAQALADALYPNVEKAHQLLSAQGVTLPALKRPGAADPAPMPAPGGAPAPAPAPEPIPADGDISFTKHVAPILVSKCGRCHVTANRGMFSMSDYEKLMAGPAAGKVVFAGDADGSRLVEVIESGDMPRGGAKVSAEELGALKRWIVQGAKFDGADPKVALTTLAPGAVAAAPMALGVTQATGSETVSFSRDIAPVLVESCNGCHIGAQQLRGRFNMANFAAFLRGGDSGPPVAPGQPASSLLVQKVRGTASGQKMPVGRPALTEEVIAKIEKWIEEGATFDGADPNQATTSVAALAKAASSTHEELLAERITASEKDWALGMPGIDAVKTETERFFVIGSVGQEKLDGYAAQADAMAAKVAEMLKHPEGEPLVKGRLTLFFFPQRYDYTEFGNMVEQRQLPAEWRGHWRYDVVDAYAALIPPRRDEYSLDGLLAQQIAGAYVASLGPLPPRWFAEGVGRAVAARLVEDDPRVAQWRTALPEVIESMQKADDFLTGKLPQESADIAAFSFASFLMSDTGRFQRLLAALRDGQEFEPAFAASYGNAPASVAELWMRSGAKAPARGR